MDSPHMYKIMSSVAALQHSVAEKHGEFDPVERDWGMIDDGSIATQMWEILNSATSKILDLMDEQHQLDLGKMAKRKE